MNIYLVEDDPLQVDWVREILTNEFGGSLEIGVINSETQFLEKFDEIATKQPACIIVDVMLPWTEAKMNQSGRPKDIGTFQDAGLRCVAKLSGDGRTKAIPVLLYTVLDKNDIILPLGAHYMRKDAPDPRFIQKIRELTQSA
jgi:CheY-like chemotaxis protein